MKDSKKKSTFYKILIEKLIGRAICALWQSCAHLSLHATRRCGAYLGTIAYHATPRHRRIVLANIKVCLPNKSPLEHRRLAQKSFREMGKLCIELPHLWQKGRQYVRQLCQQVEGQQIADTAQAKGPVIYVSLHYGCWEAFAGLQYNQEPLICLYHPNKNLLLDQFINNGRRTLGFRPLPANIKSIRVLFHALREGKNIGVLADLATRKRTAKTLAPFFGLPAYTGTLVSHLARYATVVFLCTERLEAGYRLVYFAAPDALYDRDLLVSATALNRMLEKIIMRCPEQYLWIYKRFARSPIAHIYRPKK